MNRWKQRRCDRLFGQLTIDGHFENFDFSNLYFYQDAFSFWSNDFQMREWSKTARFDEVLGDGVINMYVGRDVKGLARRHVAKLHLSNVGLRLLTPFTSHFQFHFNAKHTVKFGGFIA